MCATYPTQPAATTDSPDRDRGTRFIAAFNDIEDYLRGALNAGVHEDFAGMARTYTDKWRSPRDHRDALLAFASLRNAISHSRYYQGRPIADPVMEVVEQIEILRDQLRTPPTALAVLGTMDVSTVALDDPISDALVYVGRDRYSQLPVYEGDQYVGLLTTNAIARWLAANFAVNSGMAEVKPVSVVLDYAEPHERVRHLPKTATAVKVIDSLTFTGAENSPYTAVIITDRGKSDEAPLSIAVSHDLATLYSAISLTPAR